MFDAGVPLVWNILCTVLWRFFCLQCDLIALDFLSILESLKALYVSLTGTGVPSIGNFSFTGTGVPSSDDFSSVL
jgi:hypothetical protein